MNLKTQGINILVAITGVYIIGFAFYKGLQKQSTLEVTSNEIIFYE